MKNMQLRGMRGTICLIRARKSIVYRTCAPFMKRRYIRYTLYNVIRVLRRRTCVSFDGKLNNVSPKTFESPGAQTNTPLFNIRSAIITLVSRYKRRSPGRLAARRRGVAHSVYRRAFRSRRTRFRKSLRESLQLSESSCMPRQLYSGKISRVKIPYPESALE